MRTTTLVSAWFILLLVIGLFERVAMIGNALDDTPLQQWEETVESDAIIIESSMVEEDEDESLKPITTRQPARAFIVGTCTCSSLSYYGNRAVDTFVFGLPLSTFVGANGFSTYFTTKVYTATATTSCTQVCVQLSSTCGSTCATVTSLVATYSTSFTYVKVSTDLAASNKFTLTFAYQTDAKSSTFGTVSSVFQVGCDSITDACYASSTPTATVTVTSITQSTVLAASCTSTAPYVFHPVNAVVAAVGGVAVAGVAIAAAVRRHRLQQQQDIFDLARQWVIDDYVSSRFSREIRIQSSMMEEEEEEEGRQVRQYVVGGCTCSSARFDNQVPIVYVSSVITSSIEIDLSTT
jgi:hypothetical protein